METRGGYRLSARTRGGARGVASAAKKKEKKVGGGAEKLRCNIKQSSRRISAPVSDPLGLSSGQRGHQGPQRLQKAADQRPVKEKQAAPLHSNTSPRASSG